jgi:hypothetical protein
MAVGFKRNQIRQLTGVPQQHDLCLHEQLPDQQQGMLSVVQRAHPSTFRPLKPETLDMYTTRHCHCNGTFSPNC